MKILYKITSRSRPEKLAELIKNIKQKAQHSDYVILCTLDADDPTINKYKRLLMGDNQIKCVYGHSKSKVDAINRDMDQVGDWDLLFNVSDDQRFLLAGFDKNVLEKLKEYGCDCFLHYPDDNVDIPTMSIMGRQYYDRFSYIYHPDYKSLCCDIEAMEVAKKHGRYFFVNERIFDHFHPAFRKASTDSQYKYTQSFGDRDLQVLIARQKDGYPNGSIIYSQSDEQIVLDKYFIDKPGVLWDFGCNDGITFSNSHYLLSKCGWKGTLIDASETCIKRAMKLYPGRTDIQFLNLGIGSQNGFFLFHESGSHLTSSDHGLVSSFKEQETVRFQPYTSFEPKKVRCVDFKNFLANETIYKQANFISIDVEGMDYDILSQINLNETEVLCVEHNGSEAAKFVGYCSRFSLKLIYESSENLIFGRSSTTIPSERRNKRRSGRFVKQIREILARCFSTLS